MNRLKTWNNRFHRHVGALIRRLFLPLILVFTTAASASDTFETASDLRGSASLLQIAERFQLEPVWQEPEKKLLLRRDRAELIFKDGSHELSINGMRVFLGDPVRKYREQLHVSQVDFETTLQPLLSPAAKVFPGKLTTIVVDPGHGGRDRGTSNETLQLLEKDLTLAISKRLAKRLAAEGYRVKLTRTTDVYVALEKRAELANSVGADLFISIHLNAVGKPDVNGIETYLLTPRLQRSTGQEKVARTDSIGYPGNRNDHWNALLGFFVHRQLLHDLGTFDRGLKRARFAVLKNVEAPALLVEAGYLSNLEEARQFQSEEYHEKLVESLVAGINQYHEATNRIAATQRSRGDSS